MFVRGFIETATTEAWRPGEAKPAVILMMLGAPKPRDVAIFGQALQPGQTLRAVVDSHAMQLALEAFCSTHGLTVVYSTWEQVLTLLAATPTITLTYRWPPMRRLAKRLRRISLNQQLDNS